MKPHHSGEDFRVCTLQDEANNDMPMFKFIDVLCSIGYAGTPVKQFLKDIPAEEKGKYSVRGHDGRKHPTAFISYEGLKRFLNNNDSPSAIEFLAWVTYVVLPSLGLSKSSSCCSIKVELEQQLNQLKEDLNKLEEQKEDLVEQFKQQLKKQKDELDQLKEDLSKQQQLKKLSLFSRFKVMLHRIFTLI